MPEHRDRRDRAGHRWRTIGKDLASVSTGQILVAIILCLCSFMVVTQVRSRHDQDAYSTMSRADLVTMLDSLSDSSRQLDSEIADLRATTRELQSGADSRKVAQQQAEERLTRMKILAGTVPVHGPGVTITIDDPDNKVTSDMMLDAVEEMRDAGAEAIMLNNTVRVVADTWFAPSPDGLQVSGATVTRPYTLTIIGEPHDLKEGAKFRGGLVSQMESDKVGASVEVTTSQDLTITAIAHPQPMTHATPAR
ncbi:DUF881 domain-containing protein [Cutibacterium sp. WCA-380-WT-3A]|uniref:DUF881 domain-containing protein n=1 Tax=Cutibacterium porci TaxID=2605781 RepID=A0A7K0J6W1_9ACTN|nr:DUF881 domain-containing protein [Cutibacterium porci]MSS45573.1 DUF881 domain-containing protein [Cutibacterium porci]